MPIVGYFNTNQNTLVFKTELLKKYLAKPFRLLRLSRTDQKRYANTKLPLLEKAKDYPEEVFISSLVSTNHRYGRPVR